MLINSVIYQLLIFFSFNLIDELTNLPFISIFYCIIFLYYLYCLQELILINLLFMGYLVFHIIILLIVVFLFLIIFISAFFITIFLVYLLVLLISRCNFIIILVIIFSFSTHCLINILLCILTICFIILSQKYAIIGLNYFAKIIQVVVIIDFDFITKFGIMFFYCFCSIIDLVIRLLII